MQDIEINPGPTLKALTKNLSNIQKIYIQTTSIQKQ
jgi:hypothetical protein